MPLLYLLYLLCVPALAQTEAAVLEDPSSPDHWAALGDAWLEAGRVDAAREAHARARSLDPEAAVAPISALTSLEQQALTSPFDDEVWGDLGDQALAIGDREAALRYYEYALSLDPTDSEWPPKIVDAGGAGPTSPPFDPSTTDDEAIGDHADVLMAAGNTQQACRFYARANYLDPGDAEWVSALDGCPQTPVGGGLPALANSVDAEELIAFAIIGSVMAGVIGGMLLLFLLGVITALALQLAILSASSRRPGRGPRRHQGSSKV
jgi:tetratricopeptide (TPR) repeat protein